MCRLKNDYVIYLGTTKPGLTHAWPGQGAENTQDTWLSCNVNI